jgi:hypothetical protein
VAAIWPVHTRFGERTMGFIQINQGRGEKTCGYLINTCENGMHATVTFTGYVTLKDTDIR